MSDEYHFIQRKILNDLLFGNELKYSQLKPTNMEGSQFTFHLGKLLDTDLVLKENDIYKLKPKGKNIANSFDVDSNNPRKQAKHSVVFCAYRVFENKLQTLIYTRKKNPFFDHQGFPTGKVMYGESIIETAQRELLEETGLIGKAKLIGIRHYRVYYPTKNELVEDKVMYICKISNPIGTLSSNDEGEFYWVNIDEIKSKINNPLPEFLEILEMVEEFNGRISFLEREHFPEKF